MHTVEPIQWTSAGVVMLDQLKLPSEVVYHTYTDYRDVAKAIKTMIIRGAPAIGVAAAMGIALGVQRSEAKTLDELRAEFPVICDTLAQHPPHRRGSLLGHHALRSADSKNWRCAASRNGAGGLEANSRGDGAGSAASSRRAPRRRSRDRKIWRRAHAQIRPRHDSMQCRRARHRRNRHCTGCDPRGDRRRRTRSKSSFPKRARFFKARASLPGNCTKTASR